MIKERLIQVIESKGIAKENFYKKIGMTSASFRGSAKKTPLNSNAVENILSEIDDLNPEWLLTGKGNMLRDVYNVNQNIEGNGNYMAGKTISIKDSSEKNLKKTIESLKKDIKEKDILIKKLIEQQQKLIDKL